MVIKSRIIARVRINRVRLPILYGHHMTYSKGRDLRGKVANPASGQLNRKKCFFTIPVRAGEFSHARRVRHFRPALACPFSKLRLNSVLTYGIPPVFHGGVHLFI